MTGLDTNILVRYLTQDDPVQALVASEIISRAAERGEALFVSDIVMCEIVWVLRGAYGCTKETVVETLDMLLQTAQLRFANPPLLRLALDDYRVGKGDFADFVIGRTGSDAGCEHTVTFDRALRDDEHFSVL